jgi:XTP/dITP diphosphohydrolase
MFPSSELVVATGNKGKLNEISQLLAPLNITVRGQQDFAIAEIEETGLTFVENAILKARNTCAHTGKPALADDSGIEVDALDGVPGIYSARYAGVGASDAANVDKLLKALHGVPEQERAARFQCVMVYLRHANDPTPIICQGTWEGRIAFEPAGANGFGYDPVFWVPQHQCTAAQLSPAVKNSLSHRGQALQKMLAALQQTRHG